MEEQKTLTHGELMDEMLSIIRTIPVGDLVNWIAEVNGLLVENNLMGTGIFKQHDFADVGQFLYLLSTWFISRLVDGSADDEKLGYELWTAIMDDSCYNGLTQIPLIYFNEYRLTPSSMYPPSKFLPVFSKLMTMYEMCDKWANDNLARIKADREARDNAAA
jgi:hypothetical protein